MQYHWGQVRHGSRLGADRDRPSGGAPSGGAQSQILRRRIALYRRYLREGVDAALAGEYLRQIRDDEAELATIESTEPPS